jgi:hypothetical protein
MIERCTFAKKTAAPSWPAIEAKNAPFLTLFLLFFDKKGLSWALFAGAIRDRAAANGPKWSFFDPFLVVRFGPSVSEASFSRSPRQKAPD